MRKSLGLQLYTFSHLTLSLSLLLSPVWVSRLEGTEEKLRNRESRPEDLHVIAELREMVTEREALVKKLVVSRRGKQKPSEEVQLIL